MVGRLPNAEKKFKKIVLGADELKKRIQEVGQQITLDYQDKQEEGIVVVGILKGAVIFMADLIRNIDLDISIDFMSVSSYHNEKKSSGKINIEKDLSVDIENKHLIIVEDIVDSGLTLNYLSEYLQDKNAASISICTLFNKHIATCAVNVDYECFPYANEFVVGFGLDYAQKYRNLPFVTSLES